MRAIVLAFTLKGQEFPLIAEGIKKVAEEVGENVILIHGFMPREEVSKRGFSTEVLDLLETTFPVRLNMYNQKPLRNEMASVAKSLQATVFVIGEIKEGVAEELELYRNHALEINEIVIGQPA